MIDLREVPPRLRRRIAWLRFGLIGAMAGLVLYLFDMQVMRRNEFLKAAENNSIKRIRLRAPRGVIRDREGRVLATSRPAFEARVQVDRVSDPSATLQRARDALGLTDSEVEGLKRRLRRKSEPEITVKEDLSLAEVARLEARALEWPEFRVRQGLVRRYPNGTIASHALGHMGEIRERQLGQPEYQSYEPGAVIGQSGLEAVYEPWLRGRDGFRSVMVNSHGRTIRDLDRIDPPTPGLDLHLSLDVDIQRAVEEAFGDQAGAAVAIDARSGEVLALVSRPGFDPNAFAGKVSREQWRRYTADPAHPMFDRALMGQNPPGSVFKVVDSIAGLEEGAFDPNEAISCRGATVLHGDVFRCWKAGGHGPVSFHEALRASCNVYFYHRGDAIGIERLAAWSRRLGLGSRTGIDLLPEGEGLVPDPVWKRRALGEPWWRGETVSVAIGQGALGVSVLQVAAVMQVVANQGRAWVPQLVRRVGVSGAVRAGEVARDVELKPRTLDRVRQALWAVVNEKGGTGGRARIEGVGVSGKTGTAQAPSGGEIRDGREHAWFAGWAPHDEPAVVAAVIVEHAGHGGEAAAPIAQVIFERSLDKLGVRPLPGAVEVAGLPVVDDVLASGGGTARFVGPPRLERDGAAPPSPPERIGRFFGPPGRPAATRRGEEAVLTNRRQRTTRLDTVRGEMPPGSLAVSPLAGGGR